MGIAPARFVLGFVLSLGLALSSALIATPATAAALTNTVKPSISGKAVYSRTLTADPGEWTPAATSYTFQWLRNGSPIKKATAATYVIGLEDLGRRLSVQVTASDGAATGTATSARTAKVARATLKAKGGQKIKGVVRFTRTLDAKVGFWNQKPTRLKFQWLRFGKPIAGATKQRYRIAPEDVGTALRVQITAKAPGYKVTTVKTARTARVRHRVDVRRVVRYHVETRGTITTSVKTFRALANQTLNDPRGWRSSGIEFRQVAKGGSMTLVLSSAGAVPSFSSACSSTWSCRVGRYVIINQERWKHASPAWNAAKQGLRGYRHMVVNHESGHFLGLGHASCPGPGKLAPVMMQQSKSRNGCRFNPWPTAREIASRTPGRGRMADPDFPGYSRVDVE